MKKTNGAEAKAWNAQSEFEKGHYHDIVRRLQTKAKRDPVETTALLTAQAFLGQIEDALKLWDINKDSLDLSQKIRCRFYMGIALTRISKFRSARNMFKANAQEAGASKNPSPLVAQGIGFFHYFTGRFSRAKNFANQALQAALKTDDAYAQFLATDLLGHCTVQMGSRAEGLRLLRQAKVLAENFGNRNVAGAFATASLIYEAEGGWRHKTMVAELEKALSALEVQDAYTRSNLILELARQKTLRGAWGEARDLLDRESSSIYSFGNRVHELMLQLRFTEIAIRQGDRFAFEHFLQAARRCLNQVADNAFRIRLLGLEMKGRKIFDGRVPSDLRKNLTELSKEHSSVINNQMLFRQGLGPDPRTSESEDPIHHLFMLASENPSDAMNLCLESGYYGLWPEFAKMPNGRDFFVVLDDDRSIVIGSKEGVVYRKKALSEQHLKLLQSLIQGPRDKERLLREVWKYDYDPLRHDSLIHSAIAKLRKSFEPHADWLRTDENGWNLNSNVLWQIPRRERSIKSTETVAPEVLDDAQIDLTDLLNFRQLRALRETPQDGAWSIQIYKKTFTVSTMTAFRDLTGLLELKFLVCSGRGRATRYHIVNQRRLK
jgi:tetratricopeptide (TPR) repeat protein